MQAILNTTDKLMSLAKLVTMHLKYVHDADVEVKIKYRTDVQHPVLTVNAVQVEDEPWQHVNENGAGSVPHSELHIVVRYEKNTARCDMNGGSFIDDIDETPLGDSAGSALAKMIDDGYFDVC